jgi:DnaK suppressor protein
MSSQSERARRVLLGRRAVIRRMVEEGSAEQRQLEDETWIEWVDRAANEEARTIIETLTEVEGQQLRELGAALDRMREGRYGICETCGGPIRRLRLQAIPEARACFDCTERLERVA